MHSTEQRIIQLNKDLDDICHRKQMILKWLWLSTSPNHKAFVLWNNSTVRRLLPIDQSSYANEDALLTLFRTVETSSFSLVIDNGSLSPASNVAVNHRMWRRRNRAISRKLRRIHLFIFIIVIFWHGWDNKKLIPDEQDPALESRSDVLFFLLVGKSHAIRLLSLPRSACAAQTDSTHLCAR